MPEATTAQLTAEMLRLVLLLAMPALLVAMSVGLIVGLLQAVTQVQDQTLALAAKILAVGATIVFFGPVLALPLLRLTERLLADFPVLTR
jgi:type III secretion protein S